MGPGTIIQMGYKEFSAKRRMLLPLLLLVIGVSVIEGILLDLIGIDASVGSSILLLILTIHIYRKLLGLEIKGAPYFPYFGNYLLASLMCLLLALPLFLVPGILAVSAFGFGFSFVANVMVLAFAAIIVIPLLVLSPYFFTRLYYCLPGVAIGRKPYGFREGWRDSAGVAIPLTFAFLIVALVFVLIAGISFAILYFVMDAVTAATGPAGAIVSMVANNLLAGTVFNFSSIFLTVMQGAVYREHTYRVSSEAVEVF